MDTLAKFEVPAAPIVISLIGGNEAIPIWHSVKPLIHKAIVRSHACNVTDTDQVLAAIIQGRSQLWLAHTADRVDAAVVSYVIDWPLGTHSLFVPLIGGRNLKGWLEPMLTALEYFARSRRCMDLRGEFREGWARAAGFEVTGVTLCRKL